MVRSSRDARSLQNLGCHFGTVASRGEHQRSRFADQTPQESVLLEFAVDRKNAHHDVRSIELRHNDAGIRETQRVDDIVADIGRRGGSKRGDVRSARLTVAPPTFRCGVPQPPVIWPEIMAPL